MAVGQERLENLHMGHPMKKTEWTKPELTVLDVDKTLNGSFNNTVEDLEVSANGVVYGTTNNSQAS